MTTQEKDQLVDLPNLAAVFETLRRGRHICMSDGILYAALKSHAEEFRVLFLQLGFELQHHPRDFFYFVDRGNFTELSARMSVFMFILIEDLADRGDAIEETLMSRHFRCSELPHLVGDRYRRLMREAGVTDQVEIEHLIRTMERFGFLERLQDESFSFRSPSYRFLDLCLQMAADNGNGDDEDTAEQPEDTD
ncbi:MAG: hypothetical protein QGI24_00240 [Kiritimatiellia bacterium]|jgi:hypothetical protein|nr:hypothetical protein [Kiritimatiellia bacterium]MDP6847187.1 hypothetical protein [Kiritimatiellia bacterium]